MCLYTSSQTLTTIAETAQPVRDIEWVQKLNRGRTMCTRPNNYIAVVLFWTLCPGTSTSAWTCLAEFSSSQQLSATLERWSATWTQPKMRSTPRYGFKTHPLLMHYKWCFLIIKVLRDYKKGCCCRSTASKRILCSEKLQRSLKRGWRAAFFKEEKNWSDHRAKLPQDDQLVPVPLGQQPVWRWTRDPLSLTSEGFWEWDLWGCPTI